MFSGLDAFILGIVEGITEFLPISSTGHLILTADILRISQTEFLKSFEVIIQLGAILAIVCLYWKKLFLSRKVFSLIAVAFIPTAIVGLTLYGVIKEYLLGSTQVVLWSLLLGGVALIVFEKFGKKKEEGGALEDITFKQAFLIGLFQSIAIVPGVSRAAATIIGGLSLGISRRTIVEFSFLLAVPTMAAATGLDLIKSGSLIGNGELGVLAIGLVTAFIFALLSVRFLIRFIQTHTFISFGWYRIVLAGIFLLVI